MTESFLTASPLECHDVLKKRLEEPAPGRVQLLTFLHQLERRDLPKALKIFVTGNQRHIMINTRLSYE